MPAKEIKELRKSGKLEEALALAKTELAAEPENIWTKRNISWVFWEYMKQNNTGEQYDIFTSWLDEIKKLELPPEEIMLYEQICFPLGSLIFNLAKSNETDIRIQSLFEAIKDIPFPKPTSGASFLFKAFHKGFKNAPHYLMLADWWNFENFMPEDFEKDLLPNGTNVMSIAEQAYINYAKHLLPKYDHDLGITFNKEKAEAFLPKLTILEETHPKFQYPAYYHAKLLLALGDNENVLETILHFAKRKKNHFWVWQLLAEIFSNDADTVFACYCRALSCNSPEEMLVRLRQKMAALLIEKNLYNEAKTEIDLSVKAREAHSFPIPNAINSWKNSDWYKKAEGKKTNADFYKQFIPKAEAILFSDVPEELVFVEFVNSDRQLLNFLTKEFKTGFFKYDRFINDVAIGDVLKVRFQGGFNEGINNVQTVIKTDDDNFKKQFVKEVSGTIRILEGRTFGFVDDVYVHEKIISKLNIKDGSELSGKAFKSFNKQANEWGWKYIIN